MNELLIKIVEVDKCQKEGAPSVGAPLVIHIITPLQGSNIELRFAANYNLPLCVIGHFKLFSYRCSNICIFVIKLKARMQRIMLIYGHLFCTA